MIHIYCDGGSRGNPGKAASAFVIYHNGQEIYSEGIYLGIATNNVAEYRAVYHAFKWLEKNILFGKNRENIFSVDEEIKFTLDSELVVRQITGVYKIKNENLKNIYFEIKQLIQKFSQKISFENVSREKNKKADLLVNQKLDEQSL